MNTTTYSDGSTSTFVTRQHEGETSGQLHSRMTQEAVRLAGGREITAMTNKRMGRNDPCLCGSGRKFKRCCGRTSVLD
jgi:uncharacterized protein YchJ